MSACGWNVIDVEDGCYDVHGLTAALEQARAYQGKPTFVNVRTVIGVESKAAGQAAAHGAAFGPEEVANIKRNSGMNPDDHFVVSDEVYDFFRVAVRRGEDIEKNWNQLLEGYAVAYPELHKEFRARMEGTMTNDWTRFIPAKEDFPTGPTPSRKSAGLCCNPLAANLPTLMVGSADLTPSVNMAWKGKVDFQHVGIP